MEKKQYSNEFLARVYGAYIGCETTPFYIGLRYYQKIVGSLVQEVANYGVINEGKILLTPISKITDEHMSICKDMLCIENKRDAEYLEGMMRIRFEKGDLSDFFSLFPYYAKYFIQIVDFLRKEGYMIPFEGIDLFEAGIAIEKQ